MYTIKATIRYDGANFSGWQVQPKQRTVQGEVERALSRIANQPMRIQGAGRTDAGVHALGQVFTCVWPCAVDLEKLAKSVSCMLAPEIRIESMQWAPEGFEARKSAHSKRYAYVLAMTRESDPFTCHYAWRVQPALDMEHLLYLARQLEGTHDFAGFQCSRATANTTVRTIYSINAKMGPVIGPINDPHHFHLIFHGNGFLYKMIRNIMGTLVDIATGVIPESELYLRLQSPGPFHGKTAPAHGLFLMNVDY